MPPGVFPRGSHAGAATTRHRGRHSIAVCRTARRQARRAAPTAAKPRTAPGATKAAVLAALADGNAKTAAQIAGATGLGRATVSTTLSRLAGTGEG